MMQKSTTFTTIFREKKPECVVKTHDRCLRPPTFSVLFHTDGGL
jgi:hypothetical protein